MKTRMTTALIVMVVAGWLSGCRGEPQSAPAATPAPAGPPGLRIAMIAKSATNPIFVSARKGAEAAAKELVDALPAELVYVDKGLAPVLLAQPTYMWGYVSVQRIIDKVHLKQDVPEIIPMDVVRVTKDNLGTWSRQLKTWGFTVPEMYVKMP